MCIQAKIDFSFFDQHRDAGLRKSHGNAGAHGSTADNRCGMNRYRHNLVGRRGG